MPTPLSSVPMQRTGDPAGSVPVTACADTSVTGGEILGGKTGYTSEAGHCLASFAQIYGREYSLVAAGAAADATGVPHILDAKTIYNRLGEAVAQK